MLFNPINLPFWILLGIGIALFLMVILMGGGDDDADIEVGGDMDMDVDLDLDLDINIEADAPSLSLDADIDTDVAADADADADTEGNSQVLQVLSWLGVGKAPLVLLLAIDFSLWGLSGWMLNAATRGRLMGVIFLVSLGLSLFAGGMISRPIGKVFASFGEDTSSERLIGCLGRVSSATLPVAEQGRIGQVDVFDPARNLVTVSAVLPKWAETIPQRGEEVLVIDRQDSVYVAIANRSADRDRWLNSASRHRKSG